MFSEMVHEGNKECIKVYGFAHVVMQAAVHHLHQWRALWLHTWTVALLKNSHFLTVLKVTHYFWWVFKIKSNKQINTFFLIMEILCLGAKPVQYFIILMTV